MKHQAPREAFKYVSRCNPEERAPLFMRIGAWAEAAEAAHAMKDLDTLQVIRSKCNNPKVASQVDQYVAMLTNKR